MVTPHSALWPYSLVLPHAPLTVSLHLATLYLSHFYSRFLSIALYLDTLPSLTHRPTLTLTLTFIMWWWLFFHGGAQISWWLKFVTEEYEIVRSDDRRTGLCFSLWFVCVCVCVVFFFFNLFIFLLWVKSISKEEQKRKKKDLCLCLGLCFWICGCDFWM